MTPVSLAAFLHEYKITFPVGVDKAQDAGVPVTMSAYAMQGILAQLEYLRYLDG
jgi:hypothetical protein